MPFNLFRRGEQSEPSRATPETIRASADTAGLIAFEGYTEDWRIVGRIAAPGRLSDILNRREPVSITEVSWAPLDGTEPFSEAPGLQQVDPYDLIVVLTGPESLPVLDDERRAAMRVHKVTYDVLLNLGTVRVFGTIYLHPGSEPQQLLDRYTELFVPVTGAVAYAAGRRLTSEVQDVVLVNRSYLRGVEPVERAAAAEYLEGNASPAADEAAGGTGEAGRR